MKLEVTSLNAVLLPVAWQKLTVGLWKGEVEGLDCFLVQYRCARELMFSVRLGRSVWPIYVLPARWTFDDPPDPRQAWV